MEEENKLVVFIKIQFHLKKNKKMEEENKLVEFVYKNPVYVAACNDKKFWEEYYKVVGNWTVGPYATPFGDLERANKLVERTIDVYVLKDEDPFKTTLNLMRLKNKFLY